MVLILDNPVYSASEIGISGLGQWSRWYFHFRSKSTFLLAFPAAERVQSHWPFWENKHLHLALAIKLGRKTATWPLRWRRDLPNCSNKQDCHFETGLFTPFILVLTIQVCAEINKPVWNDCETNVSGIFPQTRTWILRRPLQNKGSLR